MLQKAYKYRIAPTSAQRHLLNMMLEECRWLYNEVLATRKSLWEDYQQSVSRNATITWLPALKDARPTLKNVHSQVLQNVCIRVDLAFEAFFRRVKTGAHPGYPRFKPYGRYDSITYPQFGNGAKIHTTWRGRKELELSKVGRIKVNWHRPIEGKIKTVTLTRSATGKWYTCFSVEQAERRQEPTKAVTGVDMGLTKFATLANGAEIPHPRFFRRDEKDLHRLQRRWDAVKHLVHTHPEKQRRRRRIARCHERIKNRRNNFAHQFSRILVDHYDVIAFEDLTITNMQKRHTLAKSIADAAWRQFITYTTYKAAEAGRIVILVNPYRTSQHCSGCGASVPKDLSVRIHDCPACGVRLDRDHNAARNILSLGLQALGAGP